MLEDLLDTPFLAALVAAHNVLAVIKETSPIVGGAGFHYGFTSAGKEQLLAHAQANATAQDLGLLIQVLVDVRGVAGI